MYVIQKNKAFDFEVHNLNCAWVGSVPPTASAANVYKSCSDSSDVDEAVNKSEKESEN